MDLYFALLFIIIEAAFFLIIVLLAHTKEFVPKKPSFVYVGNVPNTKWRAFTIEDLVKHPRYISLPPFEDCKSKTQS